MQRAALRRAALRRDAAFRSGVPIRRFGVEQRLEQLPSRRVVRIAG
jgi:hypothetical protein